MKRFLNALRAAHFAARGWILALLCIGLVWARLHSDEPLRAGFLLLIAAAMALRLWAGAHLGAHGNAARSEAPRLCRTGPYRFSRNPLYLSNILAGKGLIFFANALPAPFDTLLVLGLALHHGLLVRWEEKQLRTIWGEAYAEYLRAVPRWLGFRRGARKTGMEAPAPLAQTLAWQGRNLGYAATCVGVVWAAAHFAA